MSITKQNIIERLRTVYERAVMERGGVSFFLTDQEQQVFSDADLAALEDETGFRAMMDSPGP